jgi:phosphoribosyl 1,2-cyclic phosphodiesterase
MAVIHQQDIGIVSLGSGSRGNATYIGDATHGVLIDCGISTRQVFQRLDTIGLGSARIDGVLVIHEYIDYVASAAILERHLARTQGQRVPFFMTEGTAQGLSTKVRPETIEIVDAGESLKHLGWILEPHAVPHDTLDPIAWVVERRGVRAGVMTDLGHAPRQIEHVAAALDLAVIEFNHDQEMLLDGPYPWALKQRIRGRHGHLSNRQGARLLRYAVTGRLKKVILAHLSEENNTPERARAAAELALRDAGAPHVTVVVAHQKEPRGPITASGIHVAASPNPSDEDPEARGSVDVREANRQVSLFDALASMAERRPLGPSAHK